MMNSMYITILVVMFVCVGVLFAVLYRGSNKEEKYESHIGKNNVSQEICKSPYPNLPKDPLPPKGCPNVIQNAMKLMAVVNSKIDRSTSPLFTYILQDGENNLSGDARLQDWWCAMKKYLVNNGPASISASEMKFGQAKQESLTTDALLKACVINRGMACNEAGPTLDNLVTFPETYWYIDDIQFATADISPTSTCDPSVCKDPHGSCSGSLCKCNLGWGGVNCQTLGAGCSGCDHNNLGKERTEKIYTPSSSCMGCNNSAVSGGDPGSFAACMAMTKEVEPPKGCSDEACCHYAGCVPCGYDKEGNPNMRVSYIKYRNDPDAMAELMYKNAVFQNLVKMKGGWTDAEGNVRAFPMFSNEVAHDWSFPEDGINISGTVYGTGDKCLAMANGLPICGTFDGFGMWTWQNFCRFVEKFAELSEMNEFGLYGTEFLYPHWINAPEYQWKNPNIKLHLYLGGWPIVQGAVDQSRSRIKTMWSSVAKFVNTQKLYATHFAVDVASGVMDVDFIVQLASMIKHPTKLGAIISAAPKYGFSTESLGFAEQPGGYNYSGTTCESAEWW